MFGYGKKIIEAYGTYTLHQNLHQHGMLHYGPIRMDLNPPALRAAWGHMATAVPGGAPWPTTGLYTNVEIKNQCLFCVMIAWCHLKCGHLYWFLYALFMQNGGTK
jgi:hypothetical protein